MNLFDNIIQSSVGNFLGTKPTVPSTPSFQAPQAPRTVNYTAPQMQKKKPTFFSDEQEAYDKMMADSVPESDAIEAIKSRRIDLL